MPRSPLLYIEGIPIPSSSISYLEARDVCNHQHNRQKDPLQTIRNIVDKSAACKALSGGTEVISLLHAVYDGVLYCGFIVRKNMSYIYLFTRISGGSLGS